MAKKISFRRVKYPKKRELGWDKAILFLLLVIFLFLSLVFVADRTNTNKSGQVISENNQQFLDPDSATMRFIIEITDAKHLDSNKEFISNIYDETKALDSIWSKPISSEEFVRVTFEESLSSENDITIYPRVVSGNPKIEVYEKNSDSVIAEFTSLNDNEYNKILLTNLQGEQNTFDLLVLGGVLKFNHIIDPSSKKGSELK